MRPFAFQQAHDIAEAALLATRATGTGDDGRPQFLAGGTTLLDLMKLEVVKPAVVIDINALRQSEPPLSVSDGLLRLSAFASMADIARHEVIQRDYPVIADSLKLAASAQIRNMATLGGNVLQRTRCTYFRDIKWNACNKRTPGSGCAALEGVNRKHAILGTSPSCIATYPGDFAQALIALDAQVEIVSAAGKRTMVFADLHVAPGSTPSVETTLKPGEVINGFTLAGGPFRRSLYLKIRDRQSYEFALASAAIALDLDGSVVRGARIALGGVATTPWRAHDAEAVLTGKPITPETVQEAARHAFAGSQPRGENGFKVALGQSVMVRAIMAAAAMEG